MYNLAPALAIEGWMNPLELEFLAEQASKHKVIIEAGTYCGRSARAMADNAGPDTVIHVVDPWDGKKQYPSGKMHSNGNNVHFNQFLANLDKYIKSGKVVYHIDDFTNVDIKEPDMIFIDAIHETEPLKRDIAHAIFLMQGKGLLCGHDYSGVWREVVDVVHFVFDHVNVHDTIWWVEL